MAFRIKHIPTGKYFGHPDRGVDYSIQQIKDSLIDVGGKAFKRGTSKGRGKIWTYRLYCQLAYDQLPNKEEWEIQEF